MNNEYANPYFTVKQQGIYILQSSIEFEPDNFNEDYLAIAGIILDDTVTLDYDFTPPDRASNDKLSLSAIVQLNVGDRVSVQILSSHSGRVLREGHFSAAIFPYSPFPT